MFKLLGNDISHYQKQGFCDDVSADFIIAKATEGRTFKDGNYLIYNYVCAKRNIMFGAYHYARPENKNTPQNEASNLISAVDDGDTTPTFIALDVEGSALNVSGLENWCTEWINNVKSVLNVPVYLYVQASAYNKVKNVQNHDGFWIAHYDNDLFCDKTCAKFGIPKEQVVVKQYTSTAGTLDCDVMYMKDTGASANFNKERLAEINKTIQACHDLIENEFIK